MSEVRFNHEEPRYTNENEGYYRDQIDLVVDGEKRGKAWMVHASKPFSYYYIGDLTIDEEHRGKQHGKEFLLMLNRFLEEKNEPGILYEDIKYNYPGSPTIGMYERNGWKPVPEREDWRTYNMPPEMSVEQIQEAVDYIGKKDMFA